MSDNYKKVEHNLLKNISKFNVIITTGGASVGDEDHLVKALENNGKIFFWRAAIKPGRPIAVGKIQNTYMKLPQEILEVVMINDQNFIPLFEKDNKLITLIEWPQLIADKQDIKFITLTFKYLNQLNDRTVDIKV